MVRGALSQDDSVMFNTVSKISFIALVVLTFTACTTHPPLKEARYIDPDRFVGDWYVIANIPYFAERNRVDSKTTYIKRGPNKYDDIFQSRSKSFDNEMETLKGSAKSLNANNTEWLSRFYWIMTFRFNVLDVDDDYQIMLFGHKSRDYGWVMSRNKFISDEEYQRAMRIFADNGYDSSRFKKVPQQPEDIGKDGYQYAKN